MLKVADRKINKVIVHCSDTPTGRDIGLKEINEWHIARGFKPSSNGVVAGYHWIIRIDGTIEPARDESDIGAHCFGQNRDSIGICLVGDGTYTKSQWQSLYVLLEMTMNFYDLEPKQVFGHKEFTDLKTCPNIDDMEKFRDELELKYKGGSNGFTRFD